MLNYIGDNPNSCFYITENIFRLYCNNRFNEESRFVFYTYESRTEFRSTEVTVVPRTMTRPHHHIILQRVMWFFPYSSAPPPNLLCLNFEYRRFSGQVIWTILFKIYIHIFIYILNLINFGLPL